MGSQLTDQAETGISPGPVHEQVVVCGTGDQVAADTCVGQHAADRRGQADLLQFGIDPSATAVPLLRIASRAAV